MNLLDENIYERDESSNILSFNENINYYQGKVESIPEFDEIIYKVKDMNLNQNKNDFSFDKNVYKNEINYGDEKKSFERNKAQNIIV